MSLSPPSLQEGQNSENVSLTPPSLQEGQNSENVSLSQSAVEAQEQVKESVDVKPEVAEEKKDPVRDALVKQLDEIKQQTKVIEDALINSAAGGGMKKRKKTYYKRYKSKKSMKRKNKTSRNK